MSAILNWVLLCGREETAGLSATKGPEFDVLGWVATAHQQARAAEATLVAAVSRARQAGAPWTAIGAQLGLSRQGAQQFMM